MDKSVECRFTSEYWRELNLQHFISEQPLSQVDLPHKKSKTSQYASLQFKALIEKILKPYFKEKSESNIHNANNVKLRLSLLFMQRHKSLDEIEELINDLVDGVCEQELCHQFEAATQAISLLNQKSDQEQIECYIKEEEIYKKLNQQIDLPDSLLTEIMELEQEIAHLQHQNKSSIQSLEAHIPEINNQLQFKYQVESVNQFRLKLSRTRILPYEIELAATRELIINLQNYQVAEGIGKAQFIATSKDKNYLDNMVQVTMDRYLSNTTLFFNLDEFTSLQRLREVPFELLEPNGLRSENESQMCHFCRQMVDVKNMRQCAYNHVNMKLHEYNDDLLIEQRFRLSQQQLLTFLQDLYSENYLIENDQILCKRYFCNRCLKYDFDQHDTQVYQTWVCPLCKGLCTCIRCVRNDVIYKLKRCYLEIGGNLEDIYQNSQFEQLVADKRRQIKNIQIEFQQIKCNYQQIEVDPFSVQKNRHLTRKASNKQQLKKKKQSENIASRRIHKLSHIESSSSSVKVKRNKELNSLVGQEYPLEYLLN